MYVETSVSSLCFIDVNQVHPHACGDFLKSCPRLHRLTGSPPHMWGLRVKPIVHRRRCRFTPTYVGTSANGRRCLQPLQVHPHVCGDFWAKSTGVWAWTGSPPRMWGLLGVQRVGEAGQRFTPTYVGTSRTMSAGTMSHGVHPHVCGDFAGFLMFLTVLGGSPPRMWGLQNRQNRKHHKRWFTPTYVGTSSAGFPFTLPITVHPHVCGDFLTSCV